MVLAFISPTLAPSTVDDKADRAAWVALTAIGELTRMANDTDNRELALRLHTLCNEVTAAALGAVGVAIDRADRLTN